MEKDTKKPSDSSSTVSQQSSSYRKYWGQKNRKKNRNPEYERKRLRSIRIVDRLEQLGYRRGGPNNSFPCFCGKQDQSSVWWLCNNKSKPDHLFCLRCTKRVYEHDIKETLSKLFKIWKEEKRQMYSDDKEISVKTLLNRSGDA